MASPTGSPGPTTGGEPFRSYFTSAPSTPSSAASPRTLSGGAAIYQNLMNQFHDSYKYKAQSPRPMRKPMPEYGNDAAGLLNGTRYHGRRTPLKGKGCPPPDNNEPQFRPAKHMVPGKSFASHPNLLAMSVDSGLAAYDASATSPSRPASATGERLCLKLTDLSHKGNLQGSSLEIIAEVPQHRPIRKPGTAAPTANTKARVLVLAEDVAPPPSSPGGYTASTPREQMLSGMWQHQSQQAGPLERPSTAPARSGTAHMNEARRRYQEVQVANLDVFHYRHSGGICPDVYKLDGSRMPGPQVNSPSNDAAKDAFWASRIGYAQNRVRSLVSAPTYA